MNVSINVSLLTMPYWFYLNRLIWNYFAVILVEPYRPTTLK